MSVQAVRPIEILLVEDDADDVIITREALEEGDVLNRLNVVGDGVEAIDYLRRTGRYDDAVRPDLVLLDLNLPERDGLGGNAGGVASSTTTARASDSDPEEPGQPADRELIELLNELRVALPGVQVLFAFLLGIRFTQRYAQLDVSDRRVFFREMYVPRHAASGRGHGTGRGFGGWFVLP